MVDCHSTNSVNYLINKSTPIHTHTFKRLLFMLSLSTVKRKRNSSLLKFDFDVFILFLLDQIDFFSSFINHNVIFY